MSRACSYALVCCSRVNVPVALVALVKSAPYPPPSIYVTVSTELSQMIPFATFSRVTSDIVRITVRNLLTPPALKNGLQWKMILFAVRLIYRHLALLGPLT